MFGVKRVILLFVWFSSYFSPVPVVDILNMLSSYLLSLLHS
jgi:hypothetical protein